MNNYKITKGNWSMLKRFADQESAEEWASENIEAPYTVEFDSVHEPLPVTIKLQQDIQFGESVVLQVLAENRDPQGPYYPFTVQESIEFATMVEPIEKLLKAGSIPHALLALQATNTGIKFPQERKDYYIGLLQSYINQ